MKRSLLAAALLALALPLASFGQDTPPTGAGDTPPTNPPAPPTQPPQNPPAPPPPAPQTPTQPPAPPVPSKASLAVMKFSYGETVHEHDADGCTRAYMKEVETSALTNRFITALVQTRKFDVVDRDKLDKVLAEQQFGESGMLDPARCVKAGKIIGADYFLSGQISFFTATETIKENPYVAGNFTHDCILQIRVDMRIVDTRTSKIVAAEVGDARYEVKFQSQDPRFTQVSAELLDHVQRQLCDTLTIKVIDGVYPIKVIGWTDGVAFLNRGEGGGLRPGDVLDVYSVGEEMVDPDTGASLGATETKIGALQVTSVEAKFSKAAPFGTAMAQVPKGSICRRSKDQPPPQAPDQPKRGPAGW
jgi:curli biogenesis system outer membrane secretion channel CsgG